LQKRMKILLETDVIYLLAFLEGNEYFLYTLL